jgi:hypothetical protein
LNSWNIPRRGIRFSISRATSPYIRGKVSHPPEPWKNDLDPYSPRVDDDSEHLVEHMVLTTASLHGLCRAGCHVRALCYSATCQTLVHPLSLVQNDRQLGLIRNTRNQRGAKLRPMTKKVQLQLRFGFRVLWLPLPATHRADWPCRTF